MANSYPEPSAVQEFFLIDDEEEVKKVADSSSPKVAVASSSSTNIRSSRRRGFFQFEANGITYKILAQIGDVAPCCQVFRAENNTTTGSQGVVALKVVRHLPNKRDVFLSMWEETRRSFIKSEVGNQENGLEIIIPIEFFFFHGNNFYVQMPYFREGSLRHILVTRIADHILPETSIAAVLREILRALCYLHGRGEVHKKLNAGNIFLGDNSSAIRLGYGASTYFHKPEADSQIRIWDVNSHILHPPCDASNSIENRFWSNLNQFYEPSPGKPLSPASDIWNLGVTAIELALGPFSEYPEQGFNLNHLPAFLQNFCNKEKADLPSLKELFVDSGRAKEGTVKRIKKKFTGAGKKVVKLLGGKLGQSRPKFSGSFVTMVKRCLILDPEQRPTAQNLLHFPFFGTNENATLEFFANLGAHTE